MRKLKERRRYTKAELVAAKKAGDTEIIAELAGRMMSGDSMSVAETNFAASVLRATRPKESISFVHLASIPTAQDFIFKTLYLQYHADLEGKYGIDNAFGLVREEEKAADVIRLNEYYLAWKKIYAKNNHKENLLNIVINESTKEHKQLKKMFDRGEICSEDFCYKEKSIVLHSKYVYITAKAFFDENNSDEVIATFHGREIVINEYSFVHILNRHLAGASKQFDTGKSFHTDQEMKWFELSYDLKNIIETLGSHPDTNMSSIKFLPFKFNGVMYAVWTERKAKHKEGKIVQITRLQSCYPIEDSQELKKVNEQYLELIINDKLSAFVSL